MAINAYVGLPGSGKSYTVVKHVALPALKAGRVLVTNLPLRLEVIREEYPDADIRPFDVEKYAAFREEYSGADRDKDRRATIDARIQAELEKDAPAGCVLCLDEVWRLWPAAGGRKDTPPSFQSLLAEHRHRVDEKGNAMSVVLVTQDLAQIAPWARALVAMTYRTVNMGHLGFGKKYRVDVYQGAVTGNKPPKSGLLRQSSGSYEPKFTRYYNSHTMRKGEGEGANEKPIDARGSLWASPVWSIGLPLVIVLVGLAIWRAWAFFHPEPERRAQEEKRTLPAAGPSSSSAAGLPIGRWRVTGWVLNSAEPGRSVAFLSDGRWRVTIPFDRYCLHFVEGFVTCEYRGLFASSEFQLEAREVVAPVSAGALIGGDAET